MIKIGRVATLLTGFGIVFLFYMLNRLNYVIGSQKTSGHLSHYILDESNNEANVFPVVEFNWQGKPYHCRGRENTSLEFRKVIPVLLEDGDPQKPVIFTLKSFWLYPLFYLILPVLLWFAFTMSYIAKGESVYITLKYPFVKKQPKHFLDGKNHFPGVE